jgi:hypothetical protein
MSIGFPSPSVTSLDQIDLEISLAYIALGAVRTAWVRCPTGENARKAEEAQADVDRLLDLRLLVRS